MMKRRVLQNSWLLSVLVCACGGEGSTNPSAELGVADTDDFARVTTLGAFEGRYRAGEGFKLRALSTEAATRAGILPQGFVTPSSGSVTFNTTAADIGIGSCSASQFCATVQLTNNTSYIFDNTYAEIGSYVGVSPTGARVGWAGAAFDKSSVFGDLFVNPNNIEAANYGTITGGQTGTLEWKWDLDRGSPNADDFGFSAAVYSSVRRYQPFSGVLQNSRPALDACSLPGATTLVAASSDDTEVNAALPFPITLFDLTYDRVVVSSNGYGLFYLTGGAVPSLTQTNTSLVGVLPAGLFPFWDDLLPEGGVCMAVSGSRPARTATITWRNARISTAQPAKTWSTERITVSLTLEEGVDRFAFIYNTPEGSVTDYTRGLSATIGEHGTRLGAQYGRNLSIGSAASWLPTVSGSYGTRFYRLSFPQ